MDIDTVLTWLWGALDWLLFVAGNVADWVARILEMSPYVAVIGWWAIFWIAFFLFDFATKKRKISPQMVLSSFSTTALSLIIFGVYS